MFLLVTLNKTKTLGTKLREIEIVIERNPVVWHNDLCLLEKPFPSLKY